MTGRSPLDQQIEQKTRNRAVFVRWQKGLLGLQCNNKRSHNAVLGIDFLVYGSRYLHFT
jgi:hypothetical protein